MFQYLKKTFSALTYKIGNSFQNFSYGEFLSVVDNKVVKWNNTPTKNSAIHCSNPFAFYWQLFTSIFQCFERIENFAENRCSWSHLSRISEFAVPQPVSELRMDQYEVPNLSCKNNLTRFDMIS